MHSKEKIKKIRERALLREYVALKILEKRLISESISGTEEFFDSTFATMFGLRGLRNAVQMAVRGVRNTVATTAGESRIFVKSLLAVIVPGITSDLSISEMARQERARIKQNVANIDREYARIIDDVDNSFRNVSPDIKAALFMANPGAFIGANVTADIALFGLEVAKSLLPSWETYIPDVRNWDERTVAEMRRVLGVPATTVVTAPAANTIINTTNTVTNTTTNTASAGAPATSSPSSNTSLTEQAALPQNLDDETLKREFKNIMSNRPTQLKLSPEQIKSIKQSGTTLLQDLTKILKDPKTVNAINSSEKVLKGQDVLVDSIFQESQKKIGEVNWNNIVSEYKKQMDDFIAEQLKKQKIDDPTKIEEAKKSALSNPQTQQELVDGIKNTYKIDAINKLNAIKKGNPAPALVKKVDNAVKQLNGLVPASAPTV